LVLAKNGIGRGCARRAPRCRFSLQDRYDPGRNGGRQFLEDSDYRKFAGISSYRAPIRKVPIARRQSVDIRVGRERLLTYLHGYCVGKCA
jgi:hypothetical protein